ncbi:MAG TPA: gephyrin-like molybdotransferase Glp [Sphingomonas sp.]|uniref:molybdopterin molybdotransferase MoeA n=1 Tax=Sphingomonas sp. TaxID=28214 RepID=UPI002CC4FF8E|nr:gephyrin-like molybdotransferase Glp [Sphingomonas sp.]HMI20597.1 gephyrin-like molybdotransferase Glp [Sphingomonas sp.]
MSRNLTAAKHPPVGVAEARAAMLAMIAPLPIETIAASEAHGRVLAEPVLADRDQPPFAASSMDGYAVRSADCPGRLLLVGESAAGRGYEIMLRLGEAVRISTGAPLPDGADCVVIQEDVTRDGTHVVVPAARQADNVRPRAFDFAAGARLLDAGRRLNGVGLALAAAAGAAHLTVRRRPRVAFLSSGDELVPAGASPGPFQIYDSAVPGVSALAEHWGASVQRLAIERDDVDAIARAASAGLRECDLLIVVGGASVGDHDHAKPALARIGLQLAVDKVAVRPGKPTWFGTTDLGPVLGLPGNPASALVCALLFLRPILEKMAARASDSGSVRARLAAALPANGPREHYLRARLESDATGQLVVTAFEQQDSSLLSIFSTADALIRLPAGSEAQPAGALVDVLPLGFTC